MVAGRTGDAAPAIVNPQRTADFIKSLGVRNKTDRLEARGLAFYGAERRPAPYEPPMPERATLRALSRFRDSLVSERVALENKQADTSCSKTVRQLAKRKWRQQERDIQTVEREMKALIARAPELKRDYDLLITAPGVAFVTASVVLAELGDLRRFARARQVTAFAGLNPRRIDSGSSVHVQPRLSKSGNPRIRQALYLAAMAAVRVSGPLQQTYERLLQRGKVPKSALGAIMRRLLVLMRALIVSGTPYHCSGKPRAKLALLGG